MVLEEVSVTRLQNQVAEVAIGVHGRVEGWSTESQHEEEDAEGEHIRRQSLTWHFLSLVQLWSHVDRRAHLHIDITIDRLGEAKVTKLEGTIVSDEDILQLYVQVCVACLVVKR